MKIKELIVVEGKSDIDFLSTFLEADFYEVNGSAVSNEDLSFLKAANSNRGIIILTDPDFPGLQIRKKINNYVGNCKNAYVRKELSIKKNKVGVAESTKEEVLRAIEHSVTFCGCAKRFKMSDLFDLGLVGSNNSSKTRKYLSEILNIGYSNGKELLLKLNSIDVDIKQIKEIIKDVK